MTTANDILCNQFASRGLRMTADLPLPATDEQLTNHLQTAIIEGLKPSLPEFKQAETAYYQKQAEYEQAARWEQIKVIRDELTESGGCQVSQYWFHSDAKSKQQQMALVMLGNNIPSTLKWKTMSGILVDMTPALAQQIFAAQVTRETAIFAHAEILRNDPAADINTGWPERYIP